MKRLRSAVHNLSNSVKLSANMGWITPIFCTDVVPGDKFNHKIGALIRTQPLLAPVMHACDIDVHVYFTPDRILCPQMTEFQSGGDDGMDTTVPPYMTAPASTGYAEGSLADYLGLPTGVPDYQHSALPFRAYAKIYNEYYRDTQLQPAIAMSEADGSGGADTTTNKDLQAPCWKRDYFTTCRPFSQLGPDVVIPLTGDAPVSGIGIAGSTSSGATSAQTVRTTASAAESFQFGTTNPPLTVEMSSSTTTTNRPEIYAEMDDVTAFDIRDLREAGAVQWWQEFNNIFGGRYYEQIMARFGVRALDYRFQRPEFLGAGETKIQFSEVLATAETGTSVDVGDMKGHGISILGSNRYRFKVPEHGWIMAFLIVRPKTQYQQGIERMWSRQTRFDYLLPEFQAIGDQAVLNKEIYAAHASPNNTFGFAPQYEEYRTIPSRIAGDFRSTLNYWHMARIFSSSPSLNSDFVKCNPTTRIFPASSADQMYIEVLHDIRARRPLKKHPRYRIM